MTTQEFAEELKQLDPRLTVDPNPNRPGLANIKLLGKDICPIPDGEIYDDADPRYRYEFPNGMQARHKSRKEALEQVNYILELVSTPEGSDDFFMIND